MTTRGRVLVLWNQVDEDVYEKWRDEGPKPLEWDPTRLVPDVGTVDEELQQMLRAMRAARFDVRVVNVEDNLERVIGAIRLHRPDAIFNLVEFFNDDQIQEAYVAGLYEILGYSFTGNRPITLATCQNKYRTKLILDSAGIPTADFFLAKSAADVEEHVLDYPVIVKPAYEDASGGIEKTSVVHNEADLKRRVAYVLKEFEMPALVEEYIEGREVHAALLGNNPPEVLPLFEMEFDDSEFNPDEGEWRPQIITFQAKWDPHHKDFYTMEPVVPAEDLDEETEQAIREYAVEAFKALGCRDYARIDMRIDEDGDPYILEVNPNPDLVDGAAYMMCATASGRSYADTLGAILDLAIARGYKIVDAKKAAQVTDHLLRSHLEGKAPGMAVDPLPRAAGSGPVETVSINEIEGAEAGADGPADDREHREADEADEADEDDEDDEAREADEADEADDPEPAAPDDSEEPDEPPPDS